MSSLATLDVLQDLITCGEQLSLHLHTPPQSSFSYANARGSHRRNEINGSKVLMFHAKDDPNVRYARTKSFAEDTGVRLKTLQRGGHISTDSVTRRHWREIKKFFDSAHS